MFLFLTVFTGCHPKSVSSEPEGSRITSKITVPEVEEIHDIHPRLFITEDQLGILKEKIEADTVLSGWYESIKTDAMEILSLPPSEYKIPDGVRLLSVSREVVRRIYLLSFLYRMEGDQKYPDRAWQELEAVAAFPDWNPTHFLDVGEMCNAFAIGYDWLFQVLDEDQRTLIRKALIEKGFEPYLKGSESGEGKWVKNITNWNFVCNGGVGIAALSTGTEEEGMFSRVISHVMENLPYALQSYAPDGAWDEGAGYWGYGTHYLTCFMAALQSATGKLYGIPERAGLAEACYFPIYMSGQGNQSYQFGDGRAKRISDPAMFWLARQYNNPVFGIWHYMNISRGGIKSGIFDLLWYQSGFKKISELAELPPDRYFRHVEVVSVRSSFVDENGFMAGIKGRMVSELHHNDLDQGSFYLEALGETWAEELGSGYYNAPGYWDYSLRGGRWNYYPKRAEGQNTLVINPDRAPDQIPDAQSGIIEYNSQPDRVIAVIDLTDAYRDQAIKVMRGLCLFDDRRKVEVQDEIKLKERGEIVWFMHTTAEITAMDNSRKVILEKNGKKLVATLYSDEPAHFTVREALPLPSSPPDEYWIPPAGMKKLAVHLENVQSIMLKVSFQEISGDIKDTYSDHKMIPLKKWKIHRDKK